MTDNSRPGDHVNAAYSPFNEGINVGTNWATLPNDDDIDYSSPPGYADGSIQTAANITVADEGEDEIMFQYYDIRGNIPINLPNIPKILLEVKSKPSESRREKEISAMRLNWVYVSIMNNKFSETAEPNRKDCEDAIRWI
jgi:hypothetical protein